MKTKARTRECRPRGIGAFKPASLTIFLLLGFALDTAALVSGRDVVAEGRRLGLRPTYKKCLDASGGVTPDMRDCISEEMGYQDARLNRVYKKVMAQFESTARGELRSKEFAWLRQRAADCGAGPEPGQGAELDAYGCEVRSTAARAHELEQVLEQSKVPSKEKEFEGNE